MRLVAVDPGKIMDGTIRRAHSLHDFIKIEGRDTGRKRCSL
jgi:hypothetical protein